MLHIREKQTNYIRNRTHLLMMLIFLDASEKFVLISKEMIRKDARNGLFFDEQQW